MTTTQGTPEAPRPETLLHEALTAIYESETGLRATDKSQVLTLMFRLLSTPAGARLLALAETGAAVLQLPQGWQLMNWGYRWEVRQPQPLSVGRGSGPGPAEAVAAALEARDDGCAHPCHRAAHDTEGPTVMHLLHDPCPAHGEPRP